jgi:hypothetical protein
MAGQSCEGVGLWGGPGVEPHGPQNILYKTNYPINKGHVAPLDWVTCLHITCQSDTCPHPIRQKPSNQQLPCYHRMACTVLPHHRTDCTDRYSQHPKIFPVWLGGQIAISPSYGLRLRK